MTRIPVKPLEISYRYGGAGPGLGGIGKLTTRVVKGVVEVRYFSDLTGHDAVTQLILRKSSTRDWRAIVLSVEREQAYAVYTDVDTDDSGYPWPDKMTISGQAGVFADLTALAWAGPPVSSIAVALTQLPDHRLLVLRKSSGPFTKRKFLRQMIRCNDALLEVNHDLSEVLEKVAYVGPDVATIRSGTRRLVALAAEKRTMAAASKSWALFGFEEVIDQLVSSWSTGHPATSANTQIGRGLEKAGLRAHIEAYVSRHQRIPKGRHLVKASSGSSSWHFEVDFSQL